MLFDMLQAKKLHFTIILTKSDKITSPKLNQLYKGIAEKVTSYESCGSYFHSTAIKYIQLKMIGIH